jgi:UDP-2,4-diacetamido-2,4,6-trideoxy-beta-L-altropyranose hydrolase
MKVVFRADGGSVLGAGHISRCLTLADALRARGGYCHFVTRDRPGHLAHMIMERGHALSLLPQPGMIAEPSTYSPPHAVWLGCPWEMDARQTAVILEKIEPNWVVVDHYGLDFKWEGFIRRNGRKILVIDDLADRAHNCDFLVDPGLDPSLPRKYAALTPAECLCCVGPQFAILRPEFDEARVRGERNREGQAPQRLVVLFGGDDEGHATVEALEAIVAVSGDAIPVDVIVSPTNQDKSAIQRFCNEHQSFVMHHATREVARLFAEADLAIGAGGGATYERLYLRLPSLLKPVAENQRVPLDCLKQAGLIDIYSNGKDLQRKIGDIFKQGLRYPTDVVRNGVQTIVASMLCETVRFTPPTPLDVRRTFRWLQSPELRASFLMGLPPKRAEHFAFWRKALASKVQKIFSIYIGDRHVGNVGLKHIDQVGGTAEVWIYIGDVNARGRGLGLLALKHVEQVAKSMFVLSKIYLHVDRNNSPARKLYARAGFVDAGPPNASTHPFVSPARIVRKEKLL